MHNWAPFYLVYSKVYVDMENFLLFWFCPTRDLSTEEVLSRWDNFNSRDLFPTMTELPLLCIFVIWNLLRIFILLDALNHFLPLPVVYVVKGLRELKLSQRESTFSINRSCVIWRIFIFDEQITKTNLKFSMSTYTFDYTKWKGAQLCVR